jgi:uncharacterized protein
MSQNQGRTALITGASAGIGAEFARQLAAKGADLVLVARRLDKLQALANELRASAQIKVRCEAFDLSDAASCQTLATRLSDAGVNVDILVNNAGFGLPGSFASQPWAAHLESLQVLLIAPTELTRHLLPGMLKRGFGRVINVASLAGLVPASPGHTTYGAIKSYLIRWSASLSMEVKSKGVNVLALCPGFTYTEFHDVNGARKLVNRLPKFMWMDAKTVVSQGLVAMERGDVVLVNGKWNNFVAGFSKYLPNFIASWLVNRQAKNFREQNPNEITPKH